ncbi:polysaccharide pyruvyl transferase family protein [Bacillus salitolerans]|uniref:Polysaccharide pyruvyl transferase family protein n=1 Tax=Bacillus salitolerans TaxID=1437434 RepID=A0ABW4LMB9_9BACI
MKVGIIGNYGNDNNGDEAILTGILNQLTSHLHVETKDITIFSNHPEKTESYYGIKSVPLLYKKDTKKADLFKTVIESYKIMRTLNVLIIGGGGLLMDLYKRDAPLYGSLGMISKIAGCHVVVYGVGAGPITTSTGKYFIKKLVNMASFVSVRDEKSKALLNHIGCKKAINVIPDPAFSMPITQKRLRSTKLRKIGVTAVPYYHENYWPQADQVRYQSYVKGMARNLDTLLTSNPELEITFYSTKFPQDVEVTKHIASEMEHGERVEIIEKNLGPKDLLQISAKQDLVIGTRLHSLILALITETPIIGVGYHHKVIHFMEMIGRKIYSMAMDDLQKEDTLKTIIESSITNNWEAHQSQIQQISKDLIKRSNSGSHFLKQFVQKNQR